MTEQEKIKYAYECMVKNNPDETVKELIKLEEENKRLEHDYKIALKLISRYEKRIDKAIEMFENDNLNQYYYGMSYEFEINDFKEDVIKALRGEDNE
jgi:hypothetical protein